MSVESNVVAPQLGRDAASCFRWVVRRMMGMGGDGPGDLLFMAAALVTARSINMPRDKIHFIKILSKRKKEPKNDF